MVCFLWLPFCVFWVVRVGRHKLCPTKRFPSYGLGFGAFGCVHAIVLVAFPFRNMNPLMTAFADIFLFLHLSREPAAFIIVGISKSVD